MKNILLFSVPMLVIALAVGSCKHESLIDPTQHTVSDDCDPDTVYFVNDVFPLIINNCTESGCHDEDGDEVKALTSYEEIMNSGYVNAFDPNDSELIEKLTDDGDDRMPPPPNAPLTAAQIDLLTTWIDQGAMNNECSGGCDTTNVSYSGTIALTMDTYCTGCHSGASPSGGIDLTSYDGVAAIAADGSLLGTVQHEAGWVAMPYGGSWLPDCKIDEIRIWVENGYPND